MAWQSFGKFPTQLIRRRTFAINNNKIIYSTDYDWLNQTVSGIFEYDYNNNTHNTIQLWRDTNYFPKYFISIYHKTDNKIIFVGGRNNFFGMYKKIIIYNLSNNEMEELEIDAEIGGFARLILTQNNTHLHIIGGMSNNNHIMYNLLTNESKNIHSFHETNPKISHHALVHCKSANSMILFGGYSFEIEKYFDDFWMFKTNNTQLLIDGYVKCFLNENINNIQMKYVFSLNEIILQYLGIYNNCKWNKYENLKLPKKLCQFGYVLYNNRYIITFGGETCRDKAIDSIYYMDLIGDMKWKMSTVQCPEAGYYHALIVNNKTVHIIPYYGTRTTHFCIDICHILSPRKQNL
eukprot:367218_1